MEALKWPEGRPVAMGLFWTAAPKWWCWLIKRVTRSPWGHVGVWFQWADGARLRVEALTDGMNTRHGVGGPFDWESLCRFARKPGCRAIWCELTREREQVAAMLVEARALQRFASYSELQLLAMYARERFGWRVRENESRLVCSEFASRVAFVGGIELRDAKHERFDEVTPGSAYTACGTVHGARFTLIPGGVT